MGSVIKMAGAGNGDIDNAIAQVDIPMAGDLIGVQWAIDSDLNANGEYSRVQLSFRSSNSFDVNDDRGVISEVKAMMSLTTSGVGLDARNFYCSLPDIPIASGERLYLHVSASTGVATNVVCLLHFTFDIDKVASRRR